MNVHVDKVGRRAVATVFQMAISHTLSSHFLSAGAPPINPHTHREISLFQSRRQGNPYSRKRVCFQIQAAKLPPGVELPKEEPKYDAPFLGFTRTAETWNSRAGMIGIVMVFVVELILNKGLLQIIGVDVGKGLDIPL
ncbi:light-harvesting complex-like protein OHP1, chloroplastic [Primulina eburnea]|uniref:light-harvesting complex-like protein OHP1, chloroplastic n=1 Tax=Primulina eburnea TaxID=1245227 RepID=UPI003C6CA3D1